MSQDDEHAGIVRLLKLSKTQLLTEWKLAVLSHLQP